VTAIELTGALGAGLYVELVLVSLVVSGAALSRWTSSDGLDRALAATVSAISIGTGVALLLGMVNLLSAGIYLGVICAVGAGSALWLLQRGPVPKRVPAAWSIAGLMALLVGGTLAALAAVPIVRGLPAGHHDTRSYHISNLVSWFQSHSIWDLPFQNPGFFTATHPGNGEMAGIGLLFATHGDHLIYATNIFFGLVTVIACASITRSLDGRPDLGALAALAVLGTPLIFGTQAHGLATDLAAVAGLMAGIAAIMRSRKEHDWRWMAVAGCALGFSLGAKYTVLLLVPLVLVGAFLAIRPKTQVLWLLPGLFVLGAPWFIRNWAATGNPLFPQPIGLGGVEVFPGGQSPLLRLDTTMLDHVLARRFGPVRQWFDLGADLWGPAIFIAILGVLGVFLQGFRRGAGNHERLALAGLTVVAGIVYLVTPYTGAGVEGLRFLMGSNLRYTMAFGVVGAALAAATLPSRVLNVLIALSFAFNAWWMVRGYGFRTDLGLQPIIVVGVVVVALVGCIVVTLVGQRRLPLGPLLYGAIALLACLVAAAAVWQIDRVTDSTPLERVLAAANADEITVAGVDEMRSVWGRDLDANVKGIGGRGQAGERPPTPEQLDAAVASSRSDVLLVQDGTPGIPTGWKPPPADWRYVSTTEGADVYVRTP
jgi:hypothetical protein